MISIWTTDSISSGSGWVKVTHGKTCAGVEGYRYAMGEPMQADRQGRWLEGRIDKANLGESQRIWQFIDGPEIHSQKGRRALRRASYLGLSIGTLISNPVIDGRNRRGTGISSSDTGPAST